MPEKKKTTSRSAPARSSGARKSVTANKSKSPAPKRKSGGKKKPSDRKRANRRRFVEQWVPYILGAVGVLLTVCFILNLFCLEAAPEEHILSYPGYFICQFFFGLFGWSA